eukprot:784435-Pleurochrysis_carterae.AAC.1
MDEHASHRGGPQLTLGGVRICQNAMARWRGSRAFYSVQRQSRLRSIFWPPVASSSRRLSPFSLDVGLKRTLARSLSRARSQLARELLKHGARYLLDDATSAGELCEFAKNGKLEHVHLLLEAGYALIRTQPHTR